LTIFGESFADAKWVLRILIVGQLFNTVSGSTGHLLMMSANERAVRNATILSFVFGLLLSMSLIPVLGAIGAAIAVAGSMMLTNIFIWVIVHDQLGINVFRPNFRFVMNYWRPSTQNTGS
jgi:O-antigen/teichoic acid export membrane protein